MSAGHLVAVTDEARAKRDFLFLNCQNNKHQWKSIGGKNASCELGDACGCSVPVHECQTCGDCDYGDNDEAATVIATCHIRDFAT